jgi:hypothetical protein
VNPDEPVDRTIDLTHGGVPVRPIRINGNGAAAETPQSTVTPPGSPTADLGGLEWYPAYDRASVERYLESLDAERARLQAEIVEAERRTATAKEALAARTAQLEAALGAVVLAARAELDRIERDQQEAVAAIRAEAEAEAARIRQAARLEAETVRDAASSLSSLSASSRTEGRADAG